MRRGTSPGLGGEGGTQLTKILDFSRVFGTNIKDSHSPLDSPRQAQHLGNPGHTHSLAINSPAQETYLNPNPSQGPRRRGRERLCPTKTPIGPGKGEPLANFSQDRPSIGETQPLGREAHKGGQEGVNPPHRGSRESRKVEQATTHINMGEFYFWKLLVTPPQPKVEDNNKTKGDSDQEGEGGGDEKGSIRHPVHGYTSHYPASKNRYGNAQARYIFRKIESPEAGAHRTIRVKRSMRNRIFPWRLQRRPKQHEMQVTGKRGPLWAPQNRPKNEGPRNRSSRPQGSHSNPLGTPNEHRGNLKTTLTRRHSTQHFYYHREGISSNRAD